MPFHRCANDTTKRVWGFHMTIWCSCFSLFRNSLRPPCEALLSIQAEPNKQNTPSQWRSHMSHSFGFIGSWWHHEMEMVSTLLVHCEEKPHVMGRYPPHWSIKWSFDVFFVSLNTLLSMQSCCRSYETSRQSCVTVMKYRVDIRIHLKGLVL